ncbi:hypothetical protein [methanotrophic endosymbiont of Bathymodiolus puteoserpentis (Logatchev)]|jgi:hypothetical protein|uniref:hypothetical protein n=1 Tax=methanotrophic endosymbiont of Bathymodiolus puteoserpentis (Logatchev) TaxID=343235 RepID=UPI00157B209F|nr:hypothetical protein [methanotrophic endosymbiont of Bathymodiolus puteoserpentis (Logatchev)]
MNNFLTFLNDTGKNSKKRTLTFIIVTCFKHIRFSIQMGDDDKLDDTNLKDLRQK